jgi:hypothetical protein
MRAVAYALTSWVCLVLAAAGCRGEEALTQIVVVVDSDWDGFERAEIELQGVADAVTVDVEPRRDKPLLPRRLALVHDGGALGPIHVIVRGYVAGREQPVLVEPRRDLYYERGKTRMLRVVLRFECLGDCEAGMACLGDEQCVAADDRRATELGPWDPDLDPIDVTHRGKPFDAGQTNPPGAEGGMDAAEPGDGGEDEGGPEGGGDAQVDASDAADGTVDADVDAADADAASPPLDFPYAPSNFDPEANAIESAASEDVVLDCGVSQFDSTSLGFSNWCQAAEPAAVVVEQSDDSEAVVLVMRSLRIAAGATLRLTGSRPVILAVFGEARVDGAIDAGARGTASGPGAERDCSNGSGENGDDSGSSIGLGAGGGGGGSFGTVGGDGGQGGDVSSGTAQSAARGDAEPADTLVPLRGGCAGGDGGDGSGGGTGGNGGGGGGAVQLSVAGLLEVNGVIGANGGGGAAGSSALSGGGGGGSGGAIALEAGTLEVSGAAVLSANAGAGGAGQSGSPTDAAGSAGADGSSGTAVAVGGSPEGSGGSGGDGAAGGASPEDGTPGGENATYGYGGGGGGGGLGHIRVRGADACTLPGVWSPRPRVECADCGACPIGPSATCHPVVHASRTYFLCPARVDWDDARASCENDGLQLARINDQAENVALSAAAAEDSWIGASDIATEGDWRWTDGTAFWSGTASGSAVSGRYEAWQNMQPAQPDNQTPNGMPNADCGIISVNDDWADRSCSVLHPYFCEP